MIEGICKHLAIAASPVLFQPANNLLFWLMLLGNPLTGKPQSVIATALIYLRLDRFEHRLKKFAGNWKGCLCKLTLLRLPCFFRS
jgi:hypothetical protein